MKLILVCVPCCRRSSVCAARGLMIMINCQSVQVFEWLVVQATTTTAGEPYSFGLVASLVNTLPKRPPYATVRQWRN